MHMAVVAILLAAGEANAAEGLKVPGADLLGPFPILQFFAALIVLVVVAVGGIVWLKNKSTEPPKADAGSSQYFFDGPLKAIFDFLSEIRAWALGDLRDFIAECLSSQRQQLAQEINDAKAEVKDEINRMHNENKDTLREMNDVLVRLDERDKNRRTR